MALKLADWIAELGGVSTHECLLSVNLTTDRLKLHEPILKKLREAFANVSYYVQSPEDERPGPPDMPHVFAANNAFIRVNKDVIQCAADKPYLWSEADAIPLSAEWLNQIQTEFFACGKPFMGDRVIYPNVPEHMSGVGVYKQIDLHAPNYVLSQSVAWDVTAASQIVPKAHWTRLIQHEWKPATFAAQEDVKRIRPGAVIYHQCKDGSLIDRLRELRGGVPIACAAHSSEVAGLIPAPATPDYAGMQATEMVLSLMARVEALERRMTAPVERLVIPQPPKPKPTVVNGKPPLKRPQKKSRSPEAQAAINKRMEALRERKKAVPA